MYVSDRLTVNASGHLCVGGCDTVALAKEYGTPFYVFDETLIRENLRAFRAAIEENYGGNGLVVYASKAFNCKELCRITMQEGAGLDVVSGGELYTALSVGFPVDKIVFHGNNKTYDELVMAVENDVGRIIVDNITELETLDAIALSRGKTVGIMLRIKPGIDAHTHDFVRTGQIDSKFGFALETGEAMAAVREALGMPNLRLRGLHCHIGSQIFAPDPFVLAAEVMLDFMHLVQAETGAALPELNLGGGFSIKYLENDPMIPYDDFMRTVAQALKAKAQALGLPTPFVLIEPGRSIVGAAGVTVYTVGSVKTIPGIRTFVSVDGGMGDNPRYALYQSDYELVCANKADQPRTTRITLAGKCCESGDLIQENAPLQPVEPGDYVAVLSTGAYTYSMASNYNRIPRLPVLMAKDGQARLIIRRETYEQLIENDL